MPYIGNEVGNRFVASKAASVYSGNGSTTAFTLEHAVGSDEDILVSVDGVIQEPSVAYAVSSGTTLTFTAAPSSNSGNNIFVYYLFRTVGTVDHPATSALSATSGTFSTTLGVTGAITGSSTITGGGLLTTGGSIVIPNAGNIGSASDTDALAISSGGIINFTQTPTLVDKRLTNTPAFEAYLSSDTSISNLTNTKVPFDTEVFDSDNKYDNSTNHRFTPTIAGKYFVYANVGVKESSFTVQQHNVEIHVNGSAYRNVTNYVQTSEWAIHSNYITGILDLDGDDYVEIFTTVRQASGSPEMSGGVKVCYFGAYKLAGL